jgi:hypothetical protein
VCSGHIVAWYLGSHKISDGRCKTADLFGLFVRQPRHRVLHTRLEQVKVLDLPAYIIGALAHITDATVQLESDAGLGFPM